MIACMYVKHTMHVCVCTKNCKCVVGATMYKYTYSDGSFQCVDCVSCWLLKVHMRGTAMAGSHPIIKTQTQRTRNDQVTQMYRHDSILVYVVHNFVAVREHAVVIPMRSHGHMCMHDEQEMCVSCSGF